jgi:chemotaxis protein MotB
MGKAKTALFAAFGALLIASCTPQSNYDALQQRYEQSQAANQKLESENQTLQTQLQQGQPGQQNQQNTYTISADMLFVPHGFSISANGQAALNDIAGRLRGLKGGKIVVYGYTDDEKIGGASLKKQGITTNLDLSSKRADAVANYLRGRGINPGILSAKGRGETHPVAANSTAAGRARNRRIEIVVEGPGN